MSNQNYDALKLENQICFPLYACAKEVVRRYRPFLEELDLTYTQYIVMMVLWESKSCSVKELGNRLSLDSGTLTPVLKSLEQKGFVKRNRSQRDERVLMAEITPKGKELREKALSVPGKLAGCIKLEPQEGAELYRLLYKTLDLLKGE